MSSNISLLLTRGYTSFSLLGDALDENSWEALFLTIFGPSTRFNLIKPEMQLSRKAKKTFPTFVRKNGHDRNKEQSYKRDFG